MADRSRVTETLLQDLFTETVATIRGRLNAEDCTASDVRNALQLLKDNDVTIAPGDEEALKEALGLDNVLPFETKDLIAKK